MTAGVDTIEHGTFLTPDGVADDPALVDRLAATGLPVVLTSGTVPGGAPPPELAARMPLLVAHVRRLLDRGVVWVLSTDAGVGPQKPHDVLPWALPQALQMGASTERALSACTSRAAEALGIGAVAGRLAPGRPADLLAVAGFGLGRLTSPVPAGTVVAQPSTAPTTGAIRPTGALSVARLTSLDGSRVLGEADLGPSDGRLVLHVRAGAVTAPAGGYLEIWLINTDGRRMVSVGLLDPGHDATFVIPADLVAQGYRVVDISNELFDDKPAHSGDSIMRGSLPA